MRILQTLQCNKKNVKGLITAHKGSQCVRIYKTGQLPLGDSAANSKHNPGFPPFYTPLILALLTESGPSEEETHIHPMKRKEVLKMQLLNCEKNKSAGRRTQYRYQLV